MTSLVSPVAVNFVRSAEGLRLTKYKDTAGIWTIGYGHKLQSWEAIDTITERQATMLLVQDMSNAQNCVDACTHELGLNTNQTAACVSLCFNIGVGAFASSTLLVALKRKAWQEAADQFLVWNKEHVDGKLVVSPGLAERRAKERALFLAPISGGPTH